MRINVHQGRMAIPISNTGFIQPKNLSKANKGLKNKNQIKGFVETSFQYPDQIC